MEAIEILETIRPLPPLKQAAELRMSALDHVEDIGPRGAMEPIGADGSLPNERISKYCSFGGSWGESIAFGGTKPKQIVEYLIVSDGIPSRGNRKNVFTSELT